MKKLIIILSAFLLTGCFEKSGYLVKQCSKEEKANTLNSKITYTFEFKNDDITALNVLYEYNADDSNTIKSIKNSYEGQNRFLDFDYDILKDDLNNYNIKYYLDVTSKSDKFIISDKMTVLTNKLKNDGYVCR